MAISDQVRSQLFQQATTQSASAKAIRIPTTRGGSPRSGLLACPPGPGRGLWTPEEHLRFLEALDKFPTGPWKCIAQYVGTKTPRQAMTHGQKYRQKIARRRRGLKKVVRDFQFAETSESEQDSSEVEEFSVEAAAASARLSVDANPMSDEDFAAFVASLDLAEELELEFLSASQLSDSPLVVPTATDCNDAMPSCSLEVPDAAAAAEMMELSTEVSADSALPFTTAQQDAHHWFVMDRADASSEEFSAALAEAFRASTTEAEEQAFARPMPLPEQMLDGYLYEEESAEPLPLDLASDGIDDIVEFDGFELR